MGNKLIKSNDKIRPLRREKQYIDFQIEDGNTTLIKKMRDYLKKYDWDQGTDDLPKFDDLYTVADKPTKEKLMEKYGILDKKTLNAFIERVNALAEKLNNHELEGA